MGEFRFKRFSVTNDLSAMKVNTDGVILGVLAPLDCNDREILDIGTGTGTVALLLAQRSDVLHSPVRICGIDVDGPSVVEAAANFAGSPWPERLFAAKVALDDYIPQSEIDLIVSNPPYFDDSLTNPDERISTARHSVSLSYRDILRFAQQYLSITGRVCMVLPSDVEGRLLREARSRGLFLKSIVRVRTTPAKAAKRVVCEFSSERVAQPSETVLTIQETGKYTAQYLKLMHDFYLFA